MENSPGFETPDWLLVSAPHSVPEYWVPVVTDFLQVIAAIFDIQGRDVVLVRIDAIGDGLLFDVEYPEHFECKKAAVEAARRAFSERSTHVQQMQSGEHSQNGAGEGKVRIFSWGRAADVDVARHAASAERIKATLARIKTAGQWRPLQAPPKDWRKRLTTLAEQFPNFAHVVDMVLKPHRGILDKGGFHRHAPLLLVGPPGVGKTHFANAMAKAMGLQSALLINLAEEANASALSGSSVFWENSSPGGRNDQAGGQFGRHP